MTANTAAAPVTRHPSAARRLLVSELRMLSREPMTLTFVLVFPIVTMLVIGGSFGTTPDAAFPVNPAHWYVASYVTVVIGATGLVMLPVHIASYRERGVLRRLTASGFPRWSFAVAEIAVGLLAIAVSSVLLLAVAAPVYGVPAVEDPVRVLAATLAGSLFFVALGVLLGTLLPSARAAQAVGMVLYFPSFLLGGGGPPPAAMSDSLSSVAEVLPLTLVTDAMRGPWLGLGNETGALLAVSVLAVIASVLAVRRTAL
ncbi:ABC transporter permease [Kineosporia babensis]|uniref:Transport permease protein n=1 Tax=Kineosporia babensis TaxID=499548 RepID=A0A9X1SVZ5_9ACTN|nr:ABC transporter permease [Kineosporia babensis]MCD5314184.1 ABC transporter permease [Kineosporia babensis]